MTIHFSFSLRQLILATFMFLYGNHKIQFQQVIYLKPFCSGLQSLHSITKTRKNGYFTYFFPKNTKFATEDEKLPFIYGLIKKSCFFFSLPLKYLKFSLVIKLHVKRDDTAKTYSKKLILFLCPFPFKSK